MASSFPARQFSRQLKRGFTLIEILVVIAIIIILMGLLLPALSGARDRAYYAKTQALLTGLSNNIEAYFTTFDTYPGPAPAASTDANSPTTTAANKLSGTQNLLIGLSYSMYIVTATPPSTITTASSKPSSATLVQLGTAANGISVDTANPLGPVDLGNIDSSFAPTTYKAKAYSAFFNPGTKDVAKAVGTAGTPIDVPTIYDSWPDALPILYFRRTPGAEGSITFDASFNVTTPAQTVVSESPAVASAPYYRSENSEYLDSTALKSLSGTIYPQATKSRLAVGDGSRYDSLATLIAGKGASTTFNARGGFVLMSASSDRVYGQNKDKNDKSDDIVIVGGH